MNDDEDVRKKFTRIELFAQAQEYLKLKQSEQKLYNPNYIYQSADYTNKSNFHNIYWHVDEIFLPFKELPIYFISNYGHVYNNERNYILKPYFNRKGYLKVDFYINKQRNSRSIHRLVMETFNYFPGCNQYQVNHIDGDKTNNYFNPLSPYNNLEWCTNSQNMKHAIKMNLVNNIGENCGAAIFTNKQIDDICKILNDYPDCSTEFVLNNINFKVDPKVLSNIVYRIKEKISWTSISDNYPNIKRTKKYILRDNNFYHTFCQLIELHKTREEISQILNLDRKTVSNIYNYLTKRNGHPDIVSQYNIK